MSTDARAASQQQHLFTTSANRGRGRRLTCKPRAIRPWGGDSMRRMASFLLGGLLLTTTGCLHPPYGPLNGHSGPIPPMSALIHRENLPPAQMLMEPGPGVG